MAEVTALATMPGPSKEKWLQHICSQKTIKKEHLNSLANNITIYVELYFGQKIASFHATQLSNKYSSAQIQIMHHFNEILERENLVNIFKTSLCHRYKEDCEPLNVEPMVILWYVN